MLSDTARKEIGQKPNRKPIKRAPIYLLLLAIGIIGSLMLLPFAPPTVLGASGVRSAAGASAEAIQTTVDHFRADLGGGDLAGADGSFAGVRREINVDAVPDIFSTSSNLPANFFNFHSPRGIVFSTTGTGFRVSARSTPSALAQGNSSGNVTTPDELQVSSDRLFSTVGSNITEMTFFLPGTTAPATVSGFGAVFKNVAGNSPTTIQIFDTRGGDLGVFQVPASASSQGYSFIGVSFSTGERIARVRVTSDNTALESNASSGADAVGITHFIYSEPQLATEAILSVTNTNDSGAGSLRQAILDANANSGTDTIKFNIPGAGVKTISPSSPLPFINDPVIIDGYSQPGSSPNTQVTGNNAVLLIELNGTNAGLFVNGLTLNAGFSTVRGLVINRFQGDGINLAGSGNHTITGNFIGTNPAGTASLGNNGNGISLTSSNNGIGGNIPAVSNLISGNKADGIALGPNQFIANNNSIQGNLIGTEVSGTNALGNNGNGINVVNGNINFIGLSPLFAPNTIAFNGMNGILVSNGSNNTFINNSIFSNTLLGIDLGGDGVTSNDFNDGDSGPNTLQNYPFIQSQFSSSGGVVTNASSTTVTGSLNSTPNQSFLIDFYINPTCDSSGNGEGQTFFREITVTTNSNGNASFSATFPVPIPAGQQFMTATATGMGSTSEFSPCAQIINTTSTIQFNSTTYSVSEGVGLATITVNRSGTTNSTVTVNYATSDGTATSGQDYTPTSGTLTFNQFESSKSFSVPIIDDSVSEPNETINLTLSNPSTGAVLGSPSTAVLTIVDNESQVQFSNATYTVNEGAGFATITVTRSTNNSNSTITVNYATSDGTATSGQDYTPTSGTLTFNQFESSKSFSVPIIDDSVSEPNETINLTLSNPSTGAVLGSPSTAVLTIVDNELPDMSINDVSVTEGNSGVTNANFTVTLSVASGTTVKVNYTTADGTATAGSDYIANSGTLTFNPGETAKTISVAVIGDTVPEPNEVFAINLSSPLNTNLSRNQGIGTIINDDAGPTPSPSPTATTVQFSASTYSVIEGYTSATITVMRAGQTTGTTTVDYLVNDNTATQKSDYIFASGRLTFAPGETAKTFQVLINDDAYVEGTETATISLNHATGATVAEPSVAILAITDNDTATPTTNPIDDPSTFVRQHYRDFLNREADPEGLAYWTNQITRCNNNGPCLDARRVDVSAAFFFSNEFQDTGFFIYRVYKTAFGGQPGYLTFMRERNFVIVGSNLEASKTAYLEDLVTRPEFTSLYPGTLTPAQYVDQLNANTGGSLLPSERDSLVNGLRGGTETRATVLGKVANNTVFSQRETNPAFVLMEYFGYLRRDAETDGYLFWLNVLNNSGNFRSMVCAFINSAEYQDRFSPVRTRNDRVCGSITK